MSFVLIRVGRISRLLGTFDGESDVGALLRPDDHLGTKTVAEWAEGASKVKEQDARKLLESIAALEAERPPTRTSHPNDGSVVYEEKKVTAYFDAEGRNVLPHFATWAKVWTPDQTGGMKMEVIAVHEQSAISV